MEKVKVEIVAEWQDDLLWCPSQCYLQITFEERYFMIYLRWRHSDPWTAELIECDKDYEMHNKKYEWVSLSINYWTDEQITELKKDAIETAKKVIYNRIEI